MGYIFAIVIILGFLGSVAASLGIPIIVLIGFLVIAACIGAIWLYTFSKTTDPEEKDENGKTIIKTRTVKERLKENGIVVGFAVFILVITVSIMVVSNGGGSGSSNNSADSDSGGRYGHGEQYDKDVDYAADAFGEDPDHVNDVYEALADKMR